MNSFSSKMDLHLKQRIFKLFFAKDAEKTVSRSSKIPDEKNLKNSCVKISILVRHEKLCVRSFIWGIISFSPWNEINLQHFLKFPSEIRSWETLLSICDLKNYHCEVFLIFCHYSSCFQQKCNTFAFILDIHHLNMWILNLNKFFS